MCVRCNCTSKQLVEVKWFRQAFAGPRSEQWHGVTRIGYDRRANRAPVFEQRGTMDAGCLLSSNISAIQRRVEERSGIGQDLAIGE